MKVALVSSFVPFIYGGGRNIVEWLKPQLEAEGHDVEIIYLPFVDTPELLFPQLAAYRAIDLTGLVDVVVCFRPPAHLIRHPRKVLWFIHHLRTYYDLWDSQYRFFPDNSVSRSRRDGLRIADNAAFAEAHLIFTNSAVVGNRLTEYNGVESSILYPPVTAPERFHSVEYSDDFVYLARLEHHKRQHLVIEALAHTKSDVRLRIVGTGSSPAYAEHLRQLTVDLGVEHRVEIEDRWISELEKVAILSTALAVGYFPLDEDSYGYPSIEASLASKAVVTTSDAGGVLELVVDNSSGFITEPSGPAIAAVLDRLYFDRALAASMGAAARDRIDELGITWDTVVERLLS